MPTEDRASQDDHERRLAALRSLAEQASQAPAASSGARKDAPSQPLRPSVAPASRPLRRILPIALAVTLIVALVAGVWVVKGGMVGGKPPAASVPAARTINLTKSGLNCPIQPTWSPDGKLIAVLAIQGDCSGGQPGPQALAVVDARTGAVTRTIPLGRLLIAQGFLPGSHASLFAWTPDSASLVFSVNYDPFLALPPGAKHGLVIVSVATGAPQFFLDAAPIPHLTMANTLIWDTQTGKLVHLYAELPLAAAYTWGADGSLTPSPAGKGAAGKGATSFWQAGVIYPVIVSPLPGTPVPSDSPLLKPQTFYYVSTATQWSPDGRYVALPLTLGARLPGGVNPHAIWAGDNCPYPLKLVCASPASVTIPDAGFSAALAAAEAGWVQPQAQSTQWNTEDIAWRADGQEVATMLPGQDFAPGQSTARITIFNTHTGAQARTLSIKRVDVDFNGGGETPQFAWAPSGSSLALANIGDATLIIWRTA